MPVACDSKRDRPPAPRTRTCCILTALDLSFETMHRIVDEADIGAYQLGKGTTGLMYTCNGGFIDFGHLFDYVDQTAYYHHYVAKADASDPKKKLIPGYPNGKVIMKTNSAAADWPTVAASIAFDYSIFHEIESYWIMFPGMHNSAFSPEDLVSNYTGARIAERALRVVKATGKKFDDAVTAELKTVLGLLQPRTKAQTEAAFRAITGSWVTDAFSELALGNNGYLKRRNVNHAPIRPCFVSDPGTGCAGVPAYPSAIGTSFPAAISSSYDAEYVVDSDAQYRLGSTVKKADFVRLISDITTHANVGVLCP